MTDEKIRLLLSLGGDEARLLLDNGERVLYKRIQKRMVKLVREYDLQLPLNCLQCVYWCAKQSLVFLAGCKSRSGEGSG